MLGNYQQVYCIVIKLGPHYFAGDLDDEDDDKFFDAQEGSFDQISLEANSPVGSEADTISLGARATRTLSSDSVYEPPPPHHTGEAGAADILPLSSDKRMSVSMIGSYFIPSLHIYVFIFYLYC